MPGKQIEGTYKRDDGTYFSVKASDLWDRCPRCEGYHPNGIKYCEDTIRHNQKLSLFEKILDFFGV